MIRHAFAISLAAALTLPAAGARAEAAAGVALDIRDPSASVDAAALRGLIAAELDGADLGEASGSCQLFVDLGGEGRARLDWSCAGGVRSREIALPEAPEDRIEAIALLAGNLARDEAADVLRDLQAGSAGEKSPPPAESADEERTPADRQRASAPGADAPRAPARSVPATVGLVPPLSTNPLYGEGEISPMFSLGLVAGAASGSAGLAVSGVADVRLRSARGVQIGGAVAYAGDSVRGGQVGGAVACARDAVGGVQIGGAVACAGGGTLGGQVGGAVAVAGGGVRGAQVGGAAAVSGGGVRGAQVGGGAAVGATVIGVQVGGALAATRRLRGVQIGGALSLAQRSRGLQLGGVNIAGDAGGVQIGAINVAGSPEGVSVGALSFVKGGPVRADGWVESSGISAVALRHGSRWVHNIYAIGSTLEGDPRPMYGLGLGAHAELSERASLDVDGLAWLVVGEGWGRRRSQLHQFRVTGTFRLAPVALFAGAAANVYLSEHDDGDRFRPVFDDLYEVGDTTVRLWPSVFAGFRFEGRAGAPPAGSRE